MKAYQFKITLKGSKPPIWRRVIVPAGLSFTQFAIVINKIMGWDGEHLYEFILEPMEIKLFEDEDDDYDDYGPYENLDASWNRIDDYVEDCPKFEYVYDFGDDWRHIIKMEKIIDSYAFNYPMVLKYKGDMLIDDCGGISGYYDLLEALEDENHPDHEDMKEWIGDIEDYDFDMDEVNEDLKKYELLDETSGPMSYMEIQEDQFQGNYAFKRLSFDDEEVYDDKIIRCMFKVLHGALPDDEEEMDIMMDMFDKIITASHVEKLLEHTEMTREEIYEILDVDETTDAFINMLRSFQDMDFPDEDDELDDDEDWDDDGPVYSDEDILF